MPAPPTTIKTEDSESPSPTDMPDPIKEDLALDAEPTPDAPPTAAAAAASPTTPASTRILPLPLLTDDLETTAAKMEALAAVVRQGKNLAEQTGFLGAVHTERDPAVIARNAMTPNQGMMYDQWLASGNKAAENLPKIDWVENRLPALSGKQAGRRNKDRATAMDVIWKNDGAVATAENVAWLVANHAPVVPLVEAVVRVIRATRDVEGGGTGLSGLAMAELQTCKRVTSVCAQNVIRAQREFRRIEAEIRESFDLLNQRVKSFEVMHPSLVSKSE
jgi:hypothetical protein